jgi:hypothetical protein
MTHLKCEEFNEWMDTVAPLLEMAECIPRGDCVCFMGGCPHDTPGCPIAKPIVKMERKGYGLWQFVKVGNSVQMERKNDNNK